MSTVGPLSALINNPSSSTLAVDTSKQDYKQQFLSLLLAQLKNQDPTAPFDSAKMLESQAQFASLEQMQNLNTNFVTMMALQNTNQAASLLGRTVKGDVDGVTKTGLVETVKFVDGTPKLLVKVSATETVEMSLSGVQEVTL